MRLPETSKGYTDKVGQLAFAEHVIPSTRSIKSIRAAIRRRVHKGRPSPARRRAKYSSQFTRFLTPITYTISAAFLLYSVSGCDTLLAPSGEPTIANYERISRGMLQRDVRLLLGPPTSQFVGLHQERVWVWRVNNEKGIAVSFLLEIQPDASEQMVVHTKHLETHETLQKRWWSFDGDLDSDLLDSDLTTGLDDLLGTGRPRSDAATGAAGDGQRWLDASKDTATAGPVSVRVVSAEVGRPRLTRAAGRSAMPPEACLIITLELANTDPAKKVVHSGWSGRAVAANGVSLVDNHGNPYTARTFTGATIDGQESNVSLYADEPVLDVLVFERPVDAAKHLRLTLPASAVDQTGMLRFEIPKKMIGAEPADVVADSTRAAGGRSAPAEDAGDEGGEVHQLDVTEKAVQQAIGGMEAGEPERPLSDFDKLKRDNPGLFPEQ